jgi:hypothetical protein
VSPEPAAPPAASTQPAKTPAADAGTRATYETAFQLLRKGKWREAAAGFQEVVRQAPGTQEALIATELERLAKTFEGPPRLELREPTLDRVPGPARALAPIGPDQSGLVELAVNGTLFGLWTGLAFSIAIVLDAQALLLVALSGGGGLGATLLAAKDRRITSGGASLIGTAMELGVYDGFMLGGLLELGSPRTLFATALMTSVATTATAVALQSQLDLTVGDVALITSGAYLGTFLTGMILLFTNDLVRLSERAFFGLLLGGTNLGVLGMSIASSEIEVSRGRVLLCELGGLLGGLLAGGVILAAGATEPSARAVSGILTAGVLGGTGLATYVTRDFDEGGAPEKDRKVTLLPPSPVLVPRSGRRPMAVGLSLLNGRF